MNNIFNKDFLLIIFMIIFLIFVGYQTIEKTKILFESIENGSYQVENVDNYCDETDYYYECDDYDFEEQMIYS